MHVGQRALAHLAIALAVLVAGCASPRVATFVRPPPEAAQPARSDTAFAPVEATLHARYGPETSGFELVDRNADGLRWRLALIDTARHSIDVQYYLWHGDAAGSLLAQRLIAAADRGVHVRMLVDDLNTVIESGEKVVLRDDVARWVDGHPNLELRLFNPWKERSLVGRVRESVAELERVNHRMHNKAMIVDNQAAILGGRNIGDEYMGLNPEFNFHDLDVIGIGPVARQASAVFDEFWNSDWVLPASALPPARPEDAQAAVDRARSRAGKLAGLPELAGFDVAPRDWPTELAALGARLVPGTSSVIADHLATGAVRQDMVEEMYRLAASAQHELLVINAYIIPTTRTIDALADLHRRGVTVRVLTNSLATHDVPAVNSHYKQWRRRLLGAGVDLYEMRHDAAIQPGIADTPPTRARFMGLHSKAMVVDRRRLYIGSMNFDPRSATLNTEMGVIVDSPDLAEALAALIRRDMAPANSWHLAIDADGRLAWTDDRETVHAQPARSWWQRVEDVFFMAFPENLY
jgi:putative cardiolipin synthase